MIWRPKKYSCSTHSFNRHWRLARVDDIKSMFGIIVSVCLTKDYSIIFEKVGYTCTLESRSSML